AGDRWFTGKTVARCEASGRTWALIGAPAWSVERSGTGARFQEQLHRAGFRAIPAVERTVAGDLLHSSGDRVWALSEWMEGTPEFEQQRWTPGMLQQLGRVVGELHRRGQALVPGGTRPEQAPVRFWTG